MTDTTEDPGRRPRAEKQRNGVLTFLRDLVIIFIAALLVSFLVKTFLIRSFYIPSASMENTLQINDRVIVNELVPGAVALKRGDVVVFKDPGGWLTGSEVPSVTPDTQPAKAIDWALTQVGLGTGDSDDHLIKRVIGLPGDKVSCCNDLGQMSVNGVPIKEPYLKLPAGAPASATDFSVTVPKGTIWVMGDNRNDSKDSRYNGDTPSKGFVPMSDVTGRAFVISWPASRWTWLDDHPEVFAGVEERDE
ncbi:signal peptidase I [Curtobacterium flaccumfaciens]|uniref:Signal peptidase I n=1 Tax=Curtobacterium poinsettiae TaxID=159612 RepID=A0A9Q9P7P0_9MICO|nr:MULTISPECIES: signal peptidase I [Curtobacterium]MBO9041261.1 signal peptidase I [Curtobacterium flaccumfaciens pv. flaccumfaciens]MCS6561051.1 signal peptidase I [Curtobacterium flaccumfaciens pv. poinsettiae]MDT0233567.1 signal peptidase I [Curtobacterium sp. BRB10]UXN25254.1 signal peptidase I [Curtobacterium flaccumfaciens]UXN27980.1 signal peptidase I [Curtobacterium flaccumfaciens]